MSEQEDVEVTLEKVLDGYPLLYRLATSDVGRGEPTGDSPTSEVVISEPFEATVTWAGETFEATCLWVGENLHVTRKDSRGTTIFPRPYPTSIKYEFPDGDQGEFTFVGSNRHWS